MSQRTTWQRTWISGLIALWVVCITLSGLQAALWGWGGQNSGYTLPGPDAYPELRWMFGIEFEPPEAMGTIAWPEQCSAECGACAYRKCCIAINGEHRRHD